MRGETKQQLAAHPTATLKVRPRGLASQPSGPGRRQLTVLILAGGGQAGPWTLDLGLRAAGAVHRDLLLPADELHLDDPSSLPPSVSSPRAGTGCVAAWQRGKALQGSTEGSQRWHHGHK